uniref:AP2/ERF domain-containing protein n=1 Tax=Daucus carota subsp. sativus TaxID=79200 RepID=A0A164WXP0_DAUCS
MDHFFSYSSSSYSAPPQDPYQYSGHPQSTFTTGNASGFGNDNDQPIHIPDEEMSLASSNPKKRGGRKKVQETRHPVYRGVRRRNPDKGQNACLNFADSTWRLPVPASSDPKDIQKAAAEAAEAFRPQENHNSEDRSIPEETQELQENHEGSYLDEEAMFATPEYMNNMAQGMMLPPPQFAQSDMYYGNDDMDYVTDMSLWNY